MESVEGPCTLTKCKLIGIIGLCRIQAAINSNSYTTVSAIIMAQTTYLRYHRS